MNLTSEKLYALCKKYGHQARLWKQKFIGLLPEVNRRRLFEEKGFSSIFEFAAKLCGLSAEQVRLALNLEKRFEDKPILKGMLESGEASINKLVRIVSIATPENEEDLAAKVKVLSVSALSTLVRDEKYAQNTGENNSQTGIVDGSSKPSLRAGAIPRRGWPPFGSKSMHVHDLNFQLEGDVLSELNELNSKGIDVNELLREMLKRRREEIANKKAEIAREIQSANSGSECSRHIPAKIRKILKEEYGEKCSVVTCKKPAHVIHHAQRFSLSHSHDPHFLSPLCEDHHEISHSIDIKYLEHKVNLPASEYGAGRLWFGLEKLTASEPEGLAKKH